MAIQVAAQPTARVIARAVGFSDALFEHDGQITKREIRASTRFRRSRRARGELLWDIGAGAGSVAIEWMLADASLRVMAVERNAERATASSATLLRSACPGWL